MIETTLAKINK
jgi:dynein heavy chain